MSEKVEEPIDEMEKFKQFISEEMKRSVRDAVGEKLVELEKLQGKSEFEDFVRGERTVQALDPEIPFEEIKKKFLESNALKNFSLGSTSSARMEFHGVNLQQRAVGVTIGAGVESHQRLPGIVPLSEGPKVYLRSLLPTIKISGNLVEYVKETSFTNSASPVPENLDPVTAVQKPQSAIRFDRVATNLVQIAHYIPVSRQCKEDHSQLISWIETRLIKGLQDEIQDQFLNGDGLNNNLTGFMSAGSGIGTYQWSVDGEVGDNRMDALIKIIVQVIRSGELPDFIIMNSFDYARILTGKGSDGHYLDNKLVNFTNNTLSVAGVPVYVDSTLPDTKVLVGSRQGASVFDRGILTLEASNSHDKYFTQNMIAILAEERLQLGIIKPGAFIHATLDSPKVAGP